MGPERLIRKIADHQSGAIFSKDRMHRYVLWRRNGDELPQDNPYLIVIGLNPSTADEIENDPTVTRCIGRSQRIGLGGLIMLNAFALRSTDPKKLYKHPDPIGPDNDAWIFAACEAGLGPVLAAWGNHGSYLFRSTQLRDQLGERFRLRCLGKTKQGEPRHPLYIANASPMEYL